MSNATRVEAVCPVCGAFPTLVTEGEGGKLQYERRITAPVTMGHLVELMKNDAGYAHSWFCNLTMMAQDAGAPKNEADKRTQAFMRRVFGVETKVWPQKG